MRSQRGNALSRLEWPRFSRSQMTCTALLDSLRHGSTSAAGLRKGNEIQSVDFGAIRCHDVVDSDAQEVERATYQYLYTSREQRCCHRPSSSHVVTHSMPAWIGRQPILQRAARSPQYSPPPPPHRHRPQPSGAHAPRQQQIYRTPSTTSSTYQASPPWPNW